MNHKVSQTRMSFHPYAKCSECNWDMPPSPASRNSAKHHVKVTGHEVEVVMRDVTAYYPDGEASS